MQRKERKAREIPNLVEFLASTLSLGPQSCMPVSVRLRVQRQKELREGKTPLKRESEDRRKNKQARGMRTRERAERKGKSEEEKDEPPQPPHRREEKKKLKEEER